MVEIDRPPPEAEQRVDRCLGPGGDVQQLVGHLQRAVTRSGSSISVWWYKESASAVASSYIVAVLDVMGTSRRGDLVQAKVWRRTVDVGARRA